ncbi:hypothetical protein BMI79_21410 [Serratia oryzae]|uniref:Uncharacterized protein n=1 Tax=Serratia oryzae TaxID=2034155 RepID=A0A1S8CE18_9GAMM|nr:hypothetical protein BMI79_21410 [Serratia oryzae]
MLAGVNVKVAVIAADGKPTIAQLTLDITYGLIARLRKPVISLSHLRVTSFMNSLIPLITGDDKFF